MAIGLNEACVTRCRVRIRRSVRIARVVEIGILNPPLALAVALADYTLMIDEPFSGSIFHLEVVTSFRIKDVDKHVREPRIVSRVVVEGRPAESPVIRGG